MQLKKLLFLFVFLNLLLTINAQTTDSIRFKRGLNIGVDISDAVFYAFDNNKKAFTAMASWDLSRQYKLSVESGYSGLNVNNSNLIYKLKGVYSRLGFDWNFYKKGNANAIDMVYLGLRYGFANLNHKTHKYIITDTYWGTIENSNDPNRSYQTYWYGLLFGIRVELFKNIQLGWNINFNILSHKTGNTEISAISVPGFGKGNSSTNFGFNYAVFYKIPFY